MEDEPENLNYIYGSVQLSEYFNVDRSKILQLAKTKKIDCRWFLDIPYFDEKGVRKIGILIKKPLSQNFDFKQVIHISTRPKYDNKDL